MEYINCKFSPELVKKVMTKIQIERPSRNLKNRSSALKEALYVFLESNASKNQFDLKMYNDQCKKAIKYFYDMYVELMQKGILNDYILKHPEFEEMAKIFEGMVKNEHDSTS